MSLENPFHARRNRRHVPSSLAAVFVVALMALAPTAPIPVAQAQSITDTYCDTTDLDDDGESDAPPLVVQDGSGGGGVPLQNPCAPPCDPESDPECIPECDPMADEDNDGQPDGHDTDGDGIPDSCDDYADYVTGNPYDFSCVDDYMGGALGPVWGANITEPVGGYTDLLDAYTGALGGAIIEFYDDWTGSTPDENGSVEPIPTAWWQVMVVFGVLTEYGSQGIAIVCQVLGELDDPPQIPPIWPGGPTIGGPSYPPLPPVQPPASPENPVGKIWADVMAAYCQAVKGAEYNHYQCYSLVSVYDGDFDQDGLTNLVEFRYLTNPLLNDTDGDGLLDGEEVDLWADYGDRTRDLSINGTITNPCDALVWTTHERTPLFGSAPLETVCVEAYIDTDGDILPNYVDADSDNDGLLDGEEYLGTLCYYNFTQMPSAGVGQPAYWQQHPYGEEPYWICRDHAGIGTDPGLRDTDGDTLIDGGFHPPLGIWLGPNGDERDGEYIDYDTDPLLLDTDSDGLRDDVEVQYMLSYGIEDISSHDFDEDGLISVRDWDDDSDGLSDSEEVQQLRTDPYDPDTDDDWMPDKFERDNLLIPLVDDAQEDRDSDNATNVVEYCHDIPVDPCNTWDHLAMGPYYEDGLPVADPDAEDDMLLDGDELTLTTDPWDWDTDDDGMPDGWETLYGFAPLDPSDADEDPDRDFLDKDEDGTPEYVHTNLHEYTYGRPGHWTEGSQGAWSGYTLPLDMDTDDDTQLDGWEVYYGRDPLTPTDVNDTDYDQDGVTYPDERERGTKPFIADTDTDGLCDGNRGLGCTWPEGGQGGSPGEDAYGTDPLDNDSDDDGLFDGEEAVRWDPLATGVASDVDGDGVNGLLDPDADNDNLSDGEEVYLYGTDPGNPDTDGDGLRDDLELQVLPLATDPLDPDTDDDGLNDGDEVLEWETDPHFWDTDGDGLCDGGLAPACSFPGRPDSSNEWGESQYLTFPNDDDSDDDLMPDGWEARYGLKPRFPADAAMDEDLDGLDNLPEYNEGTDPTDVDTDDDTMQDGWEVDYAFDPLDPSDATGDPDSDDLVNRDEHEHGTHPWDPDTEDDGMPDGWEVDNELAPTQDDSAGDPDSDDLENLDEYQHGTLAQNPDTDGDSMEDGWEVQYGFDPLSAGDASGDPDNDGLENDDEFAWDTFPDDPDSDDDEMTDGWEVDNELDPLQDDTSDDPDEDVLHNLGEFRNNTFAQDPDSDDDTMEDGWEVEHGFDPLSPDDKTTDADNDGLANYLEFQEGTDPHVNDTDGDKLLDGPEYHDYQSDLHDPDTDGDGMSDGDEVINWTNAGFNPLQNLDGDALQNVVVDPDSDNDGLSDLVEMKGETNPGDPDTDGDGLCDGSRGPACSQGGEFPAGAPGEQDYGTEPTIADTDNDGLNDLAEAIRWDPAGTGVASDVDSDSRPGTLDADSDNDGLLDGPEVNTYQTRPDAKDTDGDGLGDGAEVNLHGTSPTDTDTDDDGLPDGREVDEFGSDPLATDSDGDGLLDGPEVNQHGTSPTMADTDLDGMPDKYEVENSLNPNSDDAFADKDEDGLTNWAEYNLGTRSDNVDTDGDAMPDGWEHDNGFDPTNDDDGYTDRDSDGLQNRQEFLRRTGVDNPDSDDDGINDGPEVNTYGTNPLDEDTDNDSLPDGTELSYWEDAALSVFTDYDGDGLNSLRDADSDGEGLDDATEFLTEHTDPSKKDTDGDGLTEYEEVFKYDHKYNPLLWDTDGNGLSDGEDESIINPSGDPDGDGLSNSQEENTYGTDKLIPDTDCDGLVDGHEKNFWGSSWNTGGNRLLNPDVDGDDVYDGAETGPAGMPTDLVIKSRADMYDTDGDGLDDGIEQHNSVTRDRCDEVFDFQSLGAEDSLDSSLEPRSFEREIRSGPALLDVLLDSSLVAGLEPSILYRGEQGLHYGLREAGGVYIQMPAGARLIPPALILDEAGGVARLSFQSVEDCASQTKADDPDADDDGRDDGYECTNGLNPLSCDTDSDGLGDNLETGKAYANQVGSDPTCQHYDRDTSTTTDPKDPDTDGDGISDGAEDSNTNGRLDLKLGSNSKTIGATTLPDGTTPPMTSINRYYCWLGGEVDPTDADTDDDGLSDLEERDGLDGIKTEPLCFDSDLDGLADGLERSNFASLVVNEDGSAATIPRTIKYNGVPFDSWQPPAPGARTTNAQSPDADGDGLLDGLEDKNQNGEVDSGETNPNDSDTDNDLLADGLEILFYGQANLPDPILAVVREVGDPAGVGYDTTTPFQLNPLVADSDGDGVKDGEDAFGRGAGMLGIEFGSFQMLDHPEGNSGTWTAQIVMDEVEVKLPFQSQSINVDIADYAGATYDAIPWIYNSNNPATLPDHVVQMFTDKADTTVRNQITDITGAWAPWGTKPQANLNMMLINLPDLMNPSIDLESSYLEVKVRLREADRSNGDDSVDLNAGTSRQFGGEALSFRLPMFPEPVGDLNTDSGLASGIGSAAGSNDGKTFRWANAGWEIASGNDLAGDDGGNDGHGNNDEDIDAQLSFRVGENVPRHYATLITKYKMDGLGGPKVPHGLKYGDI